MLFIKDAERSAIAKDRCFRRCCFLLPAVPAVIDSTCVPEASGGDEHWLSPGQRSESNVRLRGT